MADQHPPYERHRHRSRRRQAGLLAAVATTIAASDANVDDVSQTVTGGMFTMIMFVSFPPARPPTALEEALTETGRETGLQITVQHEDIFRYMHRVERGGVMVFITSEEILETVRMIQDENLDVRAVTMGISLNDCASRDVGRVCERIHDKIAARAGAWSGRPRDPGEYGVPIVNRGSRSRPSPAFAAGDAEDFVPVAHALDAAAAEVGINFVGGFSALVQKGVTRGRRGAHRGDPAGARRDARVCSSVNVASTRAGINMDAVASMGDALIDVAAHGRSRLDRLRQDRRLLQRARGQPLHGRRPARQRRARMSINVGVSGPGVIAAWRPAAPTCPSPLADMIKRTAFKITRVGELVAREAAQTLDAQMGIIDLSLAPSPAIGDSVAEILEAMGLARPARPARRPRSPC